MHELGYYRRYIALLADSSSQPCFYVAEACLSVSGAAASASPAQCSAPSQPASASTAQQIQATGPAAVAAVRAIQATPVGPSLPTAQPGSAASGAQFVKDGAAAQDLEDEPAAGEGTLNICHIVYLD